MECFTIKCLWSPAAGYSSGLFQVHSVWLLISIKTCNKQAHWWFSYQSQSIFIQSVQSWGYFSNHMFYASIKIGLTPHLRCHLSAIRFSLRKHMLHDLVTFNIRCVYLPHATFSLVSPALMRIKSDMPSGEMTPLACHLHDLSFS